MHTYVMIKGWSTKATEITEQTSYSVTSSRLLDFPHGKDVFSILPTRNSVQSCFLVSQGYTTVGILLLVAPGHCTVVNGLNFWKKRHHVAGFALTD